MKTLTFEQITDAVLDLPWVMGGFVQRTRGRHPQKVRKLGGGSYEMGLSREDEFRVALYGEKDFHEATKPTLTAALAEVFAAFGKEVPACFDCGL